MVAAEEFNDTEEYIWKKKTLLLSLFNPLQSSEAPANYYKGKKQKKQNKTHVFVYTTLTPSLPLSNWYVEENRCREGGKKN